MGMSTLGIVAIAGLLALVAIAVVVGVSAPRRRAPGARSRRSYAGSGSSAGFLGWSDGGSGAGGSDCGGGGGFGGGGDGGGGGGGSC